MNKSVLVGLISAAGMASSVLAQSPSNTLEGHTIELRLVVDGRPGAPTNGIDLRPENAIGPGLGYATAIGITVQARVLRPPTVPDSRGGTFPPVAVQNWGISGVANGLVSQTDFSQLSVISVIDPLGNARLERGRTPAVGGSTPSSFNYGTFNPFRGNFSGSNENNTVTGGNRATGNANGAALPTTLTKNGFIDTDSNNNQRIRGIDAGYGTGLNSRTVPLTVLSNDPNATDNWQNIYRFIFVPRADLPNLDPRQITINMTAFLRFVYEEQYSQGDPDDPTDDRWTYFGLSQIAQRNASVTFFVPAPGAAAILGIGGLLAARRRRA